MSNTDNENPNVEPDLDQDVDFGDFEEDSKPRSTGSLLNSSPLVKFGIIGAVVVVVIGLIAFMGGKDSKTPKSLVGGTNEEFKSAPGTEQVSQSMQNAIEEKNEQRVDEATKTGGSAIPTPIAPPKSLIDMGTEISQEEDPLLRWKQMQEERIRIQREQEQLQLQAQANPEQQQNIDAMKEAMTAQITGILQKQPMDIKSMTVYQKEASQQGAGAGAGSGTEPSYPPSAQAAAYSQRAGAQAAPRGPEKIIIPAGDIQYAQMMLEANSDIPGPIMALMASGPFSGGRLIGSFATEDEYLTMQFTTLVTKKGTSIPIQAIAVNPDTSLQGMATEVDHRYFSRIILPAAAKFIEGMGNAIAQTTTTVSQSSSSTTSSTQDLDTTQELGKAGAEATSKLSEFLDDEASKQKVLVRVHAGTPIGIIFMQKVTERMILQARGEVQEADSQMNQGANNPYMQQGGNQAGQMNPLQQLQQGLFAQQTMQQGLLQGLYGNAGGAGGLAGLYGAPNNNAGGQPSGSQ